VAVAAVADGEVEEVADATLDVAEAAEEATEALLDDTDDADDTDATLAVEEAELLAIELESTVEVGTGDDVAALPAAVEEEPASESPVTVAMTPPSTAAGAVTLVDFCAADI